MQIIIISLPSTATDMQVKGMPSGTKQGRTSDCSSW